MIAVATKHKNVFIDTSAYTSRRYPKELVAYMQNHGKRKKVWFGTNYPMITLGKCLRDIEDLGLSDDVMHYFLFENATTVFSLDD
jgi:predicted TIM-barrel fold metal-dependent hydrolase